MPRDRDVIASTDRQAAVRSLLDTLHALPADDRRARAEWIKSELCSQSKFITAGNFEQIHPSDLEHAFDLYETYFFDGWLGTLAEGFGNTLRFRLSTRMTSTAGTTSRWRQKAGGTDRYEIAISATLLFQTFDGETRPITVSGVECKDRLEAFQRVFEHELLHLAEMLIWDDSHCTRPRFQRIAAGMFGHTAHTHRLITPREYAHEQFGIQPGTQVEFDFEGATYRGRVNRITKRATVLVPDANGEPFSDGKRYTRYYIPLRMLRRV